MPEWYEGLDAEHLEFVTSKGWNKPAGEVAVGMAQAYREAQKFIGNLGGDPSSMIKLPKDATDPTYQSILDRVIGLSLPQDPAQGYKFDDVRFKDGTPVHEDDAAWLRDVASKNKMTPTQARGLAAAWAERSDAEMAAGAGNSEAAKAANDTALHVRWAADYDQKAFSASKALDGLRAMGLNVSLDGLDPVRYASAMDGLVSLSAQLNEAAFHRGGGNQTDFDPTRGMTPEAARARWDELSKDPAWGAKALQAGTAEHTLWQNLLRVMTGPAPTR